MTKSTLFGIASLLWLISNACFAVSAINAGFESGLSNWTTLGGVTTYSSTVVSDLVNPAASMQTQTVTPKLGGMMGALDIDNNGDLFPTSAQLNDFFGTNTDVIPSSPIDRTFAAIKSAPIVVAENGKVEQYFNLSFRDKSDEPDSAFAIIVSNNNDIIQLTELRPSANQRFSGWQVFQSNPLPQGQYTLGFFIQDGDYFSPVLALDDGPIGAGPSSVPEPSVLLLLLIGFGITSRPNIRQKIHYCR